MGGRGRGALFVASAPERCIALAGSRPAHLAVHCHPKGDEGGDGRRRRIFFSLKRGVVLLCGHLSAGVQVFSTHHRENSGAR